MAPVALLSHGETSLALLHHLVLQLTLPGNRHIRLLAVDTHDDDVWVARLTVIRPHRCILLLSELPAKLEEIGLGNDRRQGGRILLWQLPSRHRSHTPEDRTDNVRLSLHSGRSRQPQWRHDLLRDGSNLRLNINRLSVDEAEMDASRSTFSRTGAHRPPLNRTSHPSYYQNVSAS